MNLYENLFPLRLIYKANNIIAKMAHILDNPVDLGYAEPKRMSFGLLIE